MGSFLLNCGVTNNVLKENTPIVLVFIGRVVKNSDDTLAKGDFFQNWVPESMLIPAVQCDYGQVDVDKKYREQMEYMMALLYGNSVEDEDGESWKEYFNENLVSVEEMKKLSFENISEHFGEFVKILQGNGILFENGIQDVCQMKVSHVDKIVMDEIKKSPIYIDGRSLEYGGESEYSRNVISDFNNFVQYLVLLNKTKFEKYLKSEFTADLDKFGMMNTESEYFPLISNYVDIPMEKRKMEYVIEQFISQREVSLFLSYAELMGVQFAPSIYASQDYANNKGRNYRNLMQSVFSKQKETLFEDVLESRVDNGNSITGEKLDGSVSEKEYLKSKKVLMENYMKIPEVIVVEHNKMLTKEADDYSFVENVKV